VSVSTNDIKNKISATENMSKITRAMQMVSVSKLSKAEAKLPHFRTFQAEINELLQALQAPEHIASHPFLKATGKVKKTAYVLITTNRGLVGGYNNNLFKLLKDELQTTDREAKFYVVGNKGAIFARSELENVESFVFSDELKYSDTHALSQKLMAEYVKGEIDQVVVIYQRFASKLVQEAERKELLPLKMDILGDSKGRPFEVKPSQKEATHGLLMTYVSASLYELFLNGMLSEHASRMNAMQNATDNAEDIIKESQLIYNRARQAAITQELNEIVAGANAVN